jgi:hypothetical protein
MALRKLQEQCSNYVALMWNNTFILYSKTPNFPLLLRLDENTYQAGKNH